MSKQDEYTLIKAATSGDDEAFVEMFDKYYPIVNKMKRNYFLPGMDSEDWDQEARIVLYRSLKRFEVARKVTFGSFYKQNLKNRIFDLIRASNAKKRLPKEALLSVEEHESFYAATLSDAKGNCPERSVFLKEDFTNFVDSCSSLEKKALVTVILEDSALRPIWENDIINAFERCKRKFQNQVN